MPSITTEAAKGLRNTVEDAVSGEHPGIAGTAVAVIDRTGAEVFAHAAGKRGIAHKEDMAVDSVFWIASCTKMITGLVCMQLVEKGELKLDDADHLAKLCPELATLPVLKKDGTTEPQRKAITLRMLLTHTAGFSYSFFNETLRDWSHPAGIDEFSGSMRDMMQPLMFQPGEGWEYGINIDWAGIALERATGVKLNDYIQQNVCKPLGLRYTNMIPSPAMKERLAFMNWKLPNGRTVPRDHVMRRPLLIETEQEIAGFFNSGGAGMFSTPREYCKIISVLLNNGTCPTTGTQLVSSSTVDEMFTNQIPHIPGFGRQGIPASKPDLTNPIPVLYPFYEPMPVQGWGLTFMINGGQSGRSAGTGHWVGLPNCYWWADREKGVGGILCTQILPLADVPVLMLREKLEEGVYGGLVPSS